MCCLAGSAGSAQPKPCVSSQAAFFAASWLGRKGRARLVALSVPPPVTLTFCPQFKHKGVLSKYDEEIEGEKKKSFKLDAVGMADGSRERELQSIRDSLQTRAHSLDLPSLRLASEYYTPEEMVGWVRPPRWGRQTPEDDSRRKSPGVGEGLQPRWGGSGCLGFLPWRGWEAGASGAVFGGSGLSPRTLLPDS